MTLARCPAAGAARPAGGGYNKTKRERQSIMSSIEQEMKQLRAEAQGLRSENERLREMMRQTEVGLDGLQTWLDAQDGYSSVAEEALDRLSTLRNSLSNLLAERGSK